MKTLELKKKKTMTILVLGLGIAIEWSNSAIQDRDLFLQVWSRNYLTNQDTAGIGAWFHLGVHTMVNTIMGNGEQRQYLTDIWVLHLLRFFCITVQVTARRCKKTHTFSPIVSLSRGCVWDPSNVYIMDFSSHWSLPPPTATWQTEDQVQDGIEAAVERCHQDGVGLYPEVFLLPFTVPWVPW